MYIRAAIKEKIRGKIRAEVKQRVESDLLKLCTAFIVRAVRAI